MIRNAQLIPLLTATLLVCSSLAHAASPEDDLVVLYGLDDFSKQHLKRLCSALRDAGSLAPIVVFDPIDELIQFSNDSPDHGTHHAPDDKSTANAQTIDEKILAAQTQIGNRSAQSRHIDCSAQPLPDRAVRHVVRLILANESALRARALAYAEVLFEPEGDFGRRAYTELDLERDLLGPNHAMAKAWAIELPEPAPRPEAVPPPEPAPPTEPAPPPKAASFTETPPIQTPPTVLHSDPPAPHTYLRGAVPGLLIAAGSVIPQLIAERKMTDIERDCDGRVSLADCHFRERTNDRQFWAGMQLASLWGGLGLASAGLLACTLDACIWPSSWWFGDTPSGTASAPRAARLTFSANTIHFSGSF